jgi:hypothetical protein
LVRERLFPVRCRPCFCGMDDTLTFRPIINR